MGKGWYGDVEFPLKGMWSVVAQVSGAYKTRVDQAGDIDVKFHPYLFGIRATSRKNPQADVFAQFLVGATHLNVSQGNVDESTTGSPSRPVAARRSTFRIGLACA